MRSVYLTIFLALLLTVCLLVPAPFVEEAEATQVPMILDPPDQDANNGGTGVTFINNDWYIDASENPEYYNQTIFLGGNLQINNTASLTLVNCTLILNNTFNCEFEIDVLSGGTLTLVDWDGNPDTEDDMTWIGSNDDIGDFKYSMEFFSGSTFYMDGAGIYNCGWRTVADEFGIHIKTSNTEIYNSLFVGCFRALVYEGVSNSIVNNTEFYYCDVAITLMSCIGAEYTNNTIYGSTFAGFYTFASSGVLFEDNFLEWNPIGIQADANIGAKILNNTIYTSTSCGINLTTSTDSTRIENNTISCYINDDTMDGLNSWNVWNAATGTDNVWRFNSYGDYNGIDTDGDFIGDQDGMGTTPYPYNKNGVVDNYPVCPDITTDEPGLGGMHFGNVRLATQVSNDGATVYVPQGRFHEFIFLSENVSVEGDMGGGSELFGTIILYGQVTLNISYLEFGFQMPDIQVSVFVIQDSPGLFPTNCRIHNNTFFDQAIAFAMITGENNTIENNEIYGTNWGFMLQMGSNNNTVKDNYIEDSNIAIGLMTEDGVDGSATGNMIVGNTVVDNWGAAYYINNGQQNTFKDNYGITEGFAALYINNSDGLVIEDCEFETDPSAFVAAQITESMSTYVYDSRFENTIAINDTHDTLLKDCYINDTNDIALYCAGGAVHFRMEGCKINASVNGVHFNLTATIRIKDTEFMADDQYDLYFEDCYDVTVQNCEFYGNLSNGAVGFNGSCLTTTMNNTFMLDDYTNASDYVVMVGDVVAINDSFTKVNVSGDPDVAGFMAMNWLHVDVTYATNSSIATGASVNFTGNWDACGCTPNWDFHNYTITDTTPIGPIGMPYAVYQQGIDNSTWTGTYASATIVGDVTDTDGPVLLDMNTSNTVVFSLGDVWAPDEPTNLTVTALAAGNALNLTWRASFEAEGYSVMNNDTGSWSLVQNVTFAGPIGANVSYVHNGLTDGTEYFYRIFAFDQVPLESGFIEGSGTPMDILAPATPANLAADVVGQTFINLSWDAVADADVDGYKIYINDTSSSRLEWVNSTDMTYLNITGLEAETTYNICISAYDEVPNESPCSVGIQVDTLAEPVLTATFTGQVLDNETDEPVVGANVVISWFSVAMNKTMYLNLTTNATGNFTTALDFGDYNITVTANGYHDGATQALTLTAPGEVMWDLKLDPITTGIIFGFVTVDGEPLEGATVVIFDTAVNGTYYNVTTNATGYYMAELGPATYRVYVMMDGYTDSSPQLAVLDLGDNDQYDFTLNIAMVGTVTGKVTSSEDDSNIEGAELKFYDSTGALAYTVSTMADGTFTAQLDIGNYTVDVTASGYASKTGISFDIERGNTTTVDISLDPETTSDTGTISGTITDENGDPMEGVEVTVSQGGTVVDTANTDADGEYEFELTPGSYRVEIDHDGYDPEGTDVTVTADQDSSRDFQLEETDGGGGGGGGGVSGMTIAIIAIIIVVVVLVLVAILVVLIIMLRKREPDLESETPDEELEEKPEGEEGEDKPEGEEGEEEETEIDEDELPEEEIDEDEVEVPDDEIPDDEVEETDLEGEPEGDEVDEDLQETEEAEEEDVDEEELEAEFDDDELDDEDIDMDELAELDEMDEDELPELDGIDEDDLEDEIEFD